MATKVTYSSLDPVTEGKNVIKDIIRSLKTEYKYQIRIKLYINIEFTGVNNQPVIMYENIPTLRKNTLMYPGIKGSNPYNSPSRGSVWERETVNEM